MVSTGMKNRLEHVEVLSGLVKKAENCSCRTRLRIGSLTKATRFLRSAPAGRERRHFAGLTAVLVFGAGVETLEDYKRGILLFGSLGLEYQSKS